MYLKYIFLLALYCLDQSPSLALSLKILKSSFLEKVQLQSPAYSVDGPSKVAKRNDLIESQLDQLIKLNPTLKPANEESLKKYRKGKWQVRYAPHISDYLSPILLTDFTVYYEFTGGNSITSNVFYDSKIFGKGWLNTEGDIFSISDDVCKIVWKNIWWDKINGNEALKPSLSSEKDKHMFPNIIRFIGEKGFIESVSSFPVVFLDSDIAVFFFSLTKTRICAVRI